MSKTKFTKGPWGRTIFANGQPRIYRIGRDYKESDIAQTYGNDDTANADLIAAAPEMYGLLQDVMSSKCCTSEFSEQISELLSKARGEL